MSRSQTAEERFDARNTPDPVTGCWVWHGTISGHGYGQLRIHARITAAHRYSYERFVGPIPPRLLVCHHCDNPLCVNPEHLFVGTQTDNMRDMAAKGRNNQPRGERHGHTTLKEHEVLGIWGMLGALPRSEIARRFKTTHDTVNHIAQGRTWGWLTQPNATALRHQTEQ